MIFSKKFEAIELTIKDEKVLLIQLNRPDVGNALNTQMGIEMLEIWSYLTSESHPFRCIVLTGSGQKIFCSGGDLKERKGMNHDQWRRQHEIFERNYWALIDLPLPVSAAVNGHAYAGGLEIALCCDFIYASNQAKFALTEVTLGIMPGNGGTQNLPRAVGNRRASEIILTGKPFTAEQGLQWGLINSVFDPEQVLNNAIETANVIAKNAPLSVMQVKKSIRFGSQMELKTAFRFELEAYNHLVDTEDRIEGVNAFNEKRKAIFHGK